MATGGALLTLGDRDAAMQRFVSRAGRPRRETESVCAWRSRRSFCDKAATTMSDGRSRWASPRRGLINLQ